MTNTITAINCNKTLSCINLLEYFLLVFPPLNKVKIPMTNTMATAPNKVKPIKLNINSVMNYK